MSPFQNFSRPLSDACWGNICGFSPFKERKITRSALKTAISDIFIHTLGTIKRYSGALLVPDLMFKVHHNSPFKVFIGNQ